VPGFSLLLSRCSNSCGAHVVLAAASEHRNGAPGSFPMPSHAGAAHTPVNAPVCAGGCGRLADVDCTAEFPCCDVCCHGKICIPFVLVFPLPRRSKPSCCRPSAWNIAHCLPPHSVGEVPTPCTLGRYGDRYIPSWSFFEVHISFPPVTRSAKRLQQAQKHGLPTHRGAALHRTWQATNFLVGARPTVPTKPARTGRRQQSNRLW
jgi:hypothetical protein